MRQWAIARDLVFLAVTTAFLVAGRIAAHAESGGVKTLDHVYVIVLENHHYDEALNAEASPYLTDLSRRHGLATRYSGVSHPSLPNYLAMIGGDDFGVKDDAPSCFASDLAPDAPCHHVDGESLVDQLEAAGLSFALYAEALPSAGALTLASPPYPNALYAQKHNPFAYFDRIAKNASRLERLKPLDALATDLAGKRPVWRSSFQTSATTVMACRVAATP